MQKAAHAALALALALPLIAQTPGVPQPPPAAPAAPAARAAAPPQQQPSEGQKLMRAGKLDEALAWYQGELKKTPNSVALNNSAGVILDLQGRTKEARTHFQRAIDAADTPLARANAHRAMAMSYAFDGDCANTWKHQEVAAKHFESTGDFNRQGEMFNEAARVCVESGDLDTAERLYRAGQEAAMKQEKLTAMQAALWKYRTEHAMGRIEARRGNVEKARKHVAAARALLDGNKEMAENQETYYPYLTGYVALHGGDSKTALAELQKASQNDPFIQLLMAQAHEKLGQKDEAMALYRKVAASTGHNPAAATAQPVARKKLAGR